MKIAFKVNTTIFAAGLMIMALSSTLLPPGLLANEQGKAGPADQGLQQRIDFGNAHILGQSIKSGAVYLMHRKKSDIRSMIEVRQHYRDEIKMDYDLEKRSKTASSTSDAK
jgi:hypothetical protein